MRRHEGEHKKVTPRRIIRERNRKIITSVIVVVLLAGCAFMGYRLYCHHLMNKIYEVVTIEAGSPIDISSFTVAGAQNPTLITDVSGIDTNVPASYQVKVRVGNKIKVTREVILNIVDSTAPTAQAVPQTIYTDRLPDAQMTVTGVNDLSSVVISYAEQMPEVLESGQYDVAVRLVDEYGNETIVNVPFVVIDDHTPPLIYGLHDFEAFIGDSIVYLNGITVTDDYDDDPDIEVDTSMVNLTEEGYYPVTYTATDDEGNSTSTTITLHMRQKPERYYEPEGIYALARQVIEDNDICDDSMSQMEQAFRITAWVSTHIHYMMDSDKCDWTAGAYDALTTMYGDCFNYMAMCRAMYGAMGIDSITVERYPINVSSHYWNLICIDGKWYHCDACVFLSMTEISYIFMYTDDELDPYNNSYDPETLPEGITVATESVQDMLDYSTQTVISEAEQ